MFFWFNPNGHGGGTFLGQDNGGGANLKWFIDYGYPPYTPYNGNTFVFHMNDTLNNGVFLPSNPMSLPTGWNQLTFVKAGSAYSFFLNGVGIGNGTFAGTFTSSFPDPTASLIFGFTEPGVPSYTGLIEDVALYNGALAETPLPSTWTMMLIGFAGLGVVAYRRQKQSAALTGA